MFRLLRLGRDDKRSSGYEGRQDGNGQVSDVSPRVHHHASQVLMGDSYRTVRKD